jgi:hypothetical protein
MKSSAATAALAALFIATTATAATYVGVVAGTAKPSQMVRYAFEAAPDQGVTVEVTGKGGDIDCYLYSYDEASKQQHFLARDTSSRDGCSFHLGGRPKATKFWLLVQNSSDHDESYVVNID